MASDVPGVTAPTDPMEQMISSIGSIVGTDAADQLKLLQLMALKNTSAIKDAKDNPLGELDVQARVLLKAVQTKASELFPDLASAMNNVSDFLGDNPAAGTKKSKADQADELLNKFFPDIAGPLNSTLATMGNKVEAMTKNAFDAIFSSSNAASDSGASSSVTGGM